MHGGVYVDMDVLLLRNLGPLLGDEWMYQWVTDCFSSKGAVLRMKRGSAFSARLLRAIIATPPVGGSTCWGRDAYRKAAPFTNFPACFFNAGWMSNLGEDRAFFNEAPHLSRWPGAFAFHLHGSVFRLGEKAAPNSEYVAAKRALWQVLAGRFPELAAALLASNKLAALVPPLGA